jgi:membrane protease YdiL (CAAX protease family)
MDTADSVRLAPELPAGESLQILRYFVVFVVVAIWMTLGWVLRLRPNDYLLVGVPLMIVFQIGVARRPLPEIWLRPAPAKRMPWWGWLVAALFAVMPVRGWLRLPDTATWDLRLWYGCAIFGSLPLAFTVTCFTRETLKSLLLCLATGGVLGTLTMLGAALLRHRLGDFSLAQVGSGGRQFLLYLSVGFVLEEVFFRGVLDSYLHRPGDRMPWLSATFIAVLWGWWHLPISPAHTMPQMVALVIIYPMIHCLPGIPFSLFWRRSGSLLVPATVHALIDAVRNVLLR